ncbi:MAG: TetR/AcrR family transcriptional regulator [Rhodospirillales bacterium]|nr:TetR/AcrR family transcriptional regulator [Acetobacter sp.]
MSDAVTKKKQGRRPGRPRSFDREAVLAQAMLTFWKHGYEGASIPLLTEAMGITPQSLYAAFQSKETLYQEALEYYAHAVAAHAARALTEEADIFAAVGRSLRESAESFTDRKSPRGCMISLEMLSCSPGGEAAAVHARELRRAAIARMRSRLEKAVREKQLPRDVEVGKLARFFYAVVQGMASQARDGASRRELLGIGEMALQSLRNLGKSSEVPIK